MEKILNEKLLYADLTYVINGCVYDVYKSIGPGHLEKIYQKALSNALKKKGLIVQEQVTCNVIYDGEKIGNGRVDFLIEDKIILELKRGIYFSSGDYAQLNQYLLSMNKLLGLMIRFSNDRALIKRVINTNLVGKKPG
ncbi:MAG: GxxExxY protein [Bacteroidetes bacterium]|nr:GxxExxY protein [Bacteroidota bacterium]